MTLLASWLAPTPPAEFFRRWGGREAVVCRSSTPWPDLPLRHLEEALATAPIGTVEWIEGGVTKPAPASPMEAARSSHASLRINRIHTIVYAVGDLVAQLAAELDEEIGANAYLSWDAESPGLAPHTDPYDVFVAQVTGRKRWTLVGFENRPPVALRTDEDGHLHGTDGGFVLEPGELLYLPRGLRHRALAETTTEPSFHVTFAIRSKSSQSVAEWLATALGETPAEHWLPRAYEDPTVYRTAIEALRARCDALLADPDEAVRRFLVYREGLEFERTRADLPTHRAAESRRHR